MREPDEDAEVDVARRGAPGLPHDVLVAAQQQRRDADHETQREGVTEALRSQQYPSSTPIIVFSERLSSGCGPFACESLPAEEQRAKEVLDFRQYRRVQVLGSRG